MSLLRAVCLLLGLSFTGAAAAQLNEVQSVEYVTLRPGATLIRIGLKQPLAQRPTGFRTFHPAIRVVLDLPQTSVAPGRKIVQPERGLVRSIQLLGHGTSARLVIELTAQGTYETAIEGTTLLVTLRRTPPARDRLQHFGATAPPGQHRIRDVRFERGAHGEGRVIVSPADGGSGIDVRQQGRRLIVSFLDSDLDRHRQQRLDVLDFATPIDAIEARAAGPDARVVVETSGAFEYSARQSDGEFTLSVHQKPF
ncbi:MAG TPA: AMIN domain-containing protein [Burkholderiales bacterium]|nr:AMIN domain-containing protein [Burkholderiales bacterium]